MDNELNTNALTFQQSRPRLKAGHAFAPMTSVRPEAPLLYELADGSRQVALPQFAAEVLPLLDGNRTIPEILEKLSTEKGRVPFKSFFSSLQKLQTQGCLEGAEFLLTGDAASRAEMFEREPIWLTRAIFSYELRAAESVGRTNLVGFWVASLGTMILTLGILAKFIFTDLTDIPSTFLKFEGSYVKGLMFFFLAASLLISAKTIFKTLLSGFLTGNRSALRLELNLFSFALRSIDDKIYMAGGRAIGLMAFLAVATSYFFLFSVVALVSIYWAMPRPFLDDLFWVSTILALVDLNPFRKSDLSSFFNIVYNQRSAVELLPYLRNRGLFSISAKDRITDSGIYTAYSTLAVAWTMAAYNVLLGLITKNDVLILASFDEAWSNGIFAEWLACFILGTSLFLSLVYLVYDLIVTIGFNIMHPLRTKWLVRRTKAQSRPEKIADAEALVTFLQALPLFQSLGRNALLFLIHQSALRKFGKQAHVIVQDTPSNELFVLIEGDVRVQKRQPTGAIQEVTRFKAPTVFGENTLLSCAPRSADVVTLSEARVLAIPKKTIEELLQVQSLKEDAQTFLDRLLLGQYMASSELFRDAPKEVISLFFNEGEILNVPAGRQLIEQGRTDKDFYLLIRGQVDVVSNGRILAQLKQGDFFGEMALIMNAPRTASVITKDPCRLLKLSAHQFWKILSQHASIALYLETVSENRLAGSP
jgi:CRP-like cAMP-binding protein